jgi:hypothetical protein
MLVRVPTLVIWGEKDTALLTGNLDGMDKLVSVLTIKHGSAFASDLKTTNLPLYEVSWKEKPQP